MSKLLNEQLVSGKARIVEAPESAPRHQVETDRNFEIPTALYAATVACYLGFVGIMAVGFGNPVLIIPMVIFGLFIVAGFGIPAIWTRLKGNESKPKTMGVFQQAGIMTNTGRLAPRDAAVQVLLLPVLIVLWALAAVTIAALV